MSAKTTAGTGKRMAKGFDLERFLPVALFRASHPRQAAITTAVLTGAAALTGRSTRELGLVLATVLVGQVVLGWHNDLVDAGRDRRHQRTGKPIAQGYVEPGTIWFALACGVLLVVPLSLANGRDSGLAHLLIIVIAALTNAGLLRRTRWSYLPWMVTFGLWPAFLAYGGWGGHGTETAPTVLMTLLAALLGIGVHLLLSLPGLVDDNKDGFQHFPLRIALRTGAPRLLLIGGAYTTLVGVAILIAGVADGLVS